MSDVLAGVRPRTFWSIQVLRGFAALSVLVFHAAKSELAPTYVTALGIGEYGVDVFFVISGFIMFTAARSEPFGRFWARRIVRIYPLWWLALLPPIALHAVELGHLPAGREMLTSAILWPRYSLGHPNQIWPILVPGWTLSYELFFYAVFSIGIICRRVMIVPLGLLVTLVICGLLFHPQAAPLKVATSPLLLEFVLGLFIGIAVEKAWLTGRRLILGSIGVALIASSTGDFRAIIGATSGIIVASALTTELRTRLRVEGVWKLLGDASYSIYLLHLPIMQAADLFGRAHFEALGLTSRWLMLGLLVVISVLAGILVHVTVEKPLSRYFRHFVEGGRRHAAVGAAIV